MPLISLSAFQTQIDGVTPLPGGPAPGTIVISATKIPHGKYTKINWSATLGTHVHSASVAIIPQAVGGDIIATVTVVLPAALAALAGCVIWDEDDKSTSGSATIGGVTVAWALS